MKTFKYILICMLSFASLTSCIVDDTEPSLANGAGPNLAGFAQKSMSIAGISNGNEYANLINMEVKGPTFKEMTEDVTVTIAVDPSSTAIEGVHFKITSKTLTLSASNNYLGQIPITLLTKGITAPLAVAPVLKLKVTNATGTNVVANGMLMTVNFNYLCFSNLAGMYSLKMERDNGPTVLFPNEEIFELGTGYYKTSSTYRWAVGSLAPDHGMNFYDVCGEISVPNQKALQGSIGNNVYATPAKTSSVDPVTGTITIYYTITFGATVGNVVATFTKK